MKRIKNDEQGCYQTALHGSLNGALDMADPMDVRLLNRITTAFEAMDIPYNQVKLDQRYTDLLVRYDDLVKAQDIIINIFSRLYWNSIG